MLEILLCSLLTIFPDYLYRRYGQGKRIGREITLYSVWFELRWGIVTCLMLAIGLITVIFYNHPSTTNATLFFRTVPIVPEASGRVAEIFVTQGGTVAKGAPIFRLDSQRQEAEVEASRRKIAEVEAALVVARTDIATNDAKIQEARSALEQALDELRTKQDLKRRNDGVVAAREIERLETSVAGREAALAKAQIELDKTVIRAGVGGHIEQFVLRAGDLVNPFMRPAGILIPEGAGRKTLSAGFGQIEAQVMKVGMTAEVTCMSKPWTIIPMVVVDVQDFIAAGQFRAGEQLVDAQQVARPGTILAFLEPLHENGLAGVVPGSSCIANAYSSNHDLIASGKLSTAHGLALHAVDAVGIVHALLLRIQALLMPIKLLVFAGH